MAYQTLPKISFVFGTRPEAIKLAPIIIVAQKSKQFQIEICVTGQHKQMLTPILDFFSIQPTVNFNLMNPGETMADSLGNMVKVISDYLKNSNPDYVIIQGDTTSVLATALAAFYNKIKIVHVEAGLRTWDLASPFPEEMNRVLVSKIADLHFAPTKLSKNNLKKENLKNNIKITGNTVIDALVMALKLIKKTKPSYKNLPGDFFDRKQKMILITGHRRESFGESFESICNAILELALKNKNVNFVYPVHLNPNVQEPVFRILQNQLNIWLIEPLEYPSFIYLMSKSYLILSDSGGVQEEAPTLGKPVLVMRKNTERPEGLKAGVVKLVGTNKSSIIKNVQNLLDKKNIYRKMSKGGNPYGDGKSAKRILDYIAKHFNENTDN